jgi:uncharacterized membrane-anchored protein
MIRRYLGLLGVMAMLAFATVDAQASGQNVTQAGAKVCDVLGNIYQLLLYLAGGLGALIMVVQGLTWVTSADDEKGRKNARISIIHVLVGLVIVSLAPLIVAIVLPGSSSCIGAWPGFPGNST